mgnify:FL=1
MRFYGDRWGVDPPAGEPAEFEGISRNFRPDIAVRKFYKIKPAIGSTGGHPQSPATRVFLSYAGCYRFREIAEFPLSVCPQTPLYQRFYRYLLGEDINMEENKKNYALWLYPETVRRMDSSMELANCQSRSEFVEKALHFYMGYLVTDDTTEYLSKALLTSMQGMLDSNDDRMRSLLFKLCVETNMMMHVIAAHFKDDIGDLRALRGYAADEVKRTYGRISFDNAVKIQSSPED